MFRECTGLVSNKFSNSFWKTKSLAIDLVFKEQLKMKKNR